MSVLAAAILLAQGPAASPVVVTVSAPEEVVLVAGGSAQARLRVTVKEGFHIQANPASERYLVPARLDLDGDIRVKLGQPVYPPGRAHRLKGADTDLSTYAGTFPIRVPVEAARGIAPTTLALQGRLHYQACDERVCLRPAWVPVRIPLRIEPPGTGSGARYLGLGGPPGPADHAWRLR